MTSSVWFVRHVDFLKLLPAEFARRVRRVTLGRGKELEPSEDLSSSVVVVLSGKIELVKSVREGVDFRIAVLSPGEAFGTRALPEEDAYDRSRIEALEETQMIQVSMGEFLMGLQGAEGERIALDAEGGEGPVRLETPVREVLFKDVPAKLAGLLVRLHRDHADPSGRLRVGLRAGELAVLSGSDELPVLLTLAGFRKRGLVRYGTELESIDDVETLRAIAVG